MAATEFDLVIEGGTVIDGTAPRFDAERASTPPPTKTRSARPPASTPSSSTANPCGPRGVRPARGPGGAAA
ncbi:MAG: hypothetical protein U1F49_06440 [Rubrivivax sp.]